MQPLLIDFQKTKCDYSKVLNRINDRIISLKKSNDTLVIIIGVSDNCAYGDTGSVKLTNDTLFLNSHILSNEQEIADCDCYFEFTYKLFPVKQSVFNFKYNDKSLNLSDLLYLPAEFNNNLLMYDNHAYSYEWLFYDSGELRAIKISKLGYTEKIDFFQNGKIKKNFQIFNDFDIHILKEWNENGELINYENTLNIKRNGLTNDQKKDGVKLLIKQGD